MHDAKSPKRDSLTESTASRLSLFSIYSDDESPCDVFDEPFSFSFPDTLHPDKIFDQIS